MESKSPDVQYFYFYFKKKIVHSIIVLSFAKSLNINSKNVLPNRIVIRLTSANNEVVSLKSLSPEALDSFLSVVSSLKSIALSVSTGNLIFSIREGSALCAVESSPDNMNSMYDEIDLAIKGKSKDKDVTSNLRRIQEQFKRSGYNYDFVYKKNRNEINLYLRVKNSNRIRVKQTKNKFDHKLKILEGFLNQIGGKLPNYHFDYGHNNKITINCSMEQARHINKYLYQNVNALVICKEWNKADKESEYTHKLILGNKEARVLKSFINKYNKENDLVSKLTILHDFVDNQIENSKDCLDTLKYLLIGFNEKSFHLSELKTMLVISKPFSENEVIKGVRLELLETYNLIKSNINV